MRAPTSASNSRRSFPNNPAHASAPFAPAAGFSPRRPPGPRSGRPRLPGSKTRRARWTRRSPSRGRWAACWRAGLIDRRGARRGFSIGLTGWSIAGVLHGLVNGVRGMPFTRFRLGRGEAGHLPASIKSVAEWFPRKERSFAPGLFNAGGGGAEACARKGRRRSERLRTSLLSIGTAASQGRRWSPTSGRPAKSGTPRRWGCVGAQRG